jgi:hypothetical protein
VRKVLISYINLAWKRKPQLSLIPLNEVPEEGHGETTLHAKVGFEKEKSESGSDLIRFPFQAQR